MQEANEPAEQPEFASAEEASAGSRTPQPGVRLRLWPGFAAAALLLFSLIVPLNMNPESPKAFMPLMFGSMAAYVAMGVWWLFASRAPVGDRLLGLVIVLGGLGIGMGFAYHPSLQFELGGMTMMFFVAPAIVITLLVTLLLTRGMGWPKSRLITAGVAAAMLVAIGFVRYENASSRFSSTFTPRWQPNSEELLLASLGERPAAESQFEPAPEGVTLGGSDWPGFRGALRDGLVEPGQLAASWEASPPERLWARAIGPGWSSFCVVGGLAITQEQRGESECVVAYDADTGEPVWSNEVESRFEESAAGPGPRATPTFDDGALYTCGAEGVVQKLDAATGDVIWRKHLFTDEDRGWQGESSLEVLPMWGFASSPLIVDFDAGPKLALVYAGNPQPESEEAGSVNRSVIAFNADTGDVVWARGVGWRGYSSAHLATLLGERQVLMCTNVGLESLDPATGERLWFFDWSIGEFGRVNQPTVLDESTVVLSAGYDSGTMVINVSRDGDAWSATEQWKQPSTSLVPYFNDIVAYKGHLYGIHKTYLVCIDLETGKPTWPRKSKRKSQVGNGQLVLDAESGHLLVTTEETGEALLIKAQPEELEIVSRLRVLEPEESKPGKNWNHPVVAGGRLYVRNGVEAACFELPSGG